MIFNPPFIPYALDSIPDDLTTPSQFHTTTQLPHKSSAGDHESSYWDLSSGKSTIALKDLALSRESVAYVPPYTDSAPKDTDYTEPEPHLDTVVRPRGRQRKYTHLAHLSSDEYRKAANKLHVADSLRRTARRQIVGAVTIEIEGDHSIAMADKLEQRWPRSDDFYEEIWTAYDAWRAVCVERDVLVRQFQAALGEHKLRETETKTALDKVIEKWS